MARVRTQRSSPSSFRALGFATALLAGAFVVQLVSASSAAPQGRAPFCPSGNTVAASKLPSRVETRDCDLVGKLITSGSVAVGVPPPGRGSGAAAVGASGESSLYVANFGDTVSITTSASGESAVDVIAEGAAPPPCDEMDIANCRPPCQDESYNLFQGRPRVKNSQPWFFNRSTTPSTLTVNKALDQIKAGTQAILKGRNDCGMGDPNSKFAPYRGATQKKAMSSETYCFSDFNSDKNVVDFGKLGSGLLGLACYSTQWVGDGPVHIVEADIRFNKRAPWTTTPDADDCSGEYDLQGVAAHERGHAFGLDHTGSDNAHIPQTMYYASYPCSSYQRTLGKGDVLGLRALY